MDWIGHLKTRGKTGFYLFFYEVFLGDFFGGGQGEGREGSAIERGQTYNTFCAVP